MQALEIKVECISTDREMETLYETTFPSVAAWISSMHGSFEEARDVFHDALVIFMERNAGQGIPADVAPEAYLFGIVRHLWYKKFRNDRHLVSLDAMENADEGDDDLVLSVNDAKLLRLLEQTGKKCMDLLQAFYFEMQNLSTLSGRLGYRNVHTATVQKYKCLEKIRQTVKQNSAVYEDFLN